MKWLRAALRLLLVTVVTGGSLSVLLVGILLTFPFRRANSAWRRFVMKTWSRCLLPVLGVRLQTSGSAPATPFLMVSNHLSYVDIPLIGSRTGAIFVAKSEIANWPVIGFICRSINTIFIDRTLRRDIPRVIKTIHRELELGMGVVVFAEGTSSMGAEVLPFRTSLLEIAVRAEIPVSYAALSYHTRAGDEPAEMSVCWWGGMGFGPHLWKLLMLDGVDAKLVFGDEQIRDDDRKRLAERLHRAVSGCFEPVVEEVVEAAVKEKA